MGDLVVVLTTGLGLGAAYALLGTAVSAVAVSTRGLHLAIGAVLSASLLLYLTLTVDVLDLPVALVAVGVALVAALVSALLAVTVGRPGTSVPVGVAGLAVAGIVLQAAASRWVGTSTLRPDPLVDVGPLTIASTTVSSGVLAALLLGLPAAAAATWTVARSPFGRRLRLVGGSPGAARDSGVDPRWTRLQAWMWAGVMATAAGLLVAPITFTSTGQASAFTLRAVAAAAVLGLGRPARVGAGGLLLGLAEAAGGRAWPAAGAEVAVAVLLIGLVAIRGVDHAEGRTW